MDTQDLPSGRRRSSVGRLLSAYGDRFMLSLPQPLLLGPGAFTAARVVDKGDLSARVQETLFKLQIINPPPAHDSEPYQPVDTTKITRNFANQLFFVSGLILRRIVALLFVWEEQCIRLRMLDDEEREIRSLLRDPPTGLREELQLRLRSVQQRRALLPGRQQDQARPQDELPAYAEQ